MNQDARLIPWTTFQSAYVDPGTPVNIPVVGSPKVTLFSEKGELLGMVVDGLSESDLPAIRLPRSISVRSTAGRVTVSSGHVDAFAAFYSFLLDIANRLQVAGESVGAAIQGALSAWRRMLAAPLLMDHEAVIGLVGELWVLERLLKNKGVQFIDSWTGPDRQAHDFRFDALEVEVKTTGGSEREHIISSSHQLVPSPGLELHLASIHLEDAGLADGWSLTEQIGTVRGILKGDAVRLDRFNESLRSLGWFAEDAPYYTDRYRLRSSPTVICVDDRFPRIGDEELHGVLGERMDRIRGLRYSVNVEGLGSEYPGEPFMAVLPLGEEIP